MTRGMIDPMCSTHRTFQPRTLVYTRNRSALLAETRTQRTRELRAAALQVIAPMPHRPGAVWNEIARLDRPTRRFDLVQEPMRLAAHAGADVESIADFYITMFLDAIAAAPKPVTFDLATASIRAIREQSEAIEAQAIAHATRCPSDSERSMRETREAIGANEFYLAAVRRARLAGRVG